MVTVTTDRGGVKKIKDTEYFLEKGGGKGEGEREGEREGTGVRKKKGEKIY